MPRFNSSAIERAEYDEPSSTLQIWFVESGGPYSYYGVPPHIFQGLCAAASQGQYFAVYIRDKYNRDTHSYRR
ncbi:KTSC domain-containing protein [Methylobacterium radiodurans]|uniref:KTSC domain-containing protein n=1 Tax=Methylobacterium radiodurans TaxID=2202828 RepID=A0A2U8VS87_9HYPH|nr:KTSC domain-containing protein [Methylobacterium radiodurans]AWN36535.1 KTSC domain-containing protein [Methylobacterium radiodurans]